MKLRGVVLMLALAGTGCSPGLPESESAAAQLYAARCDGCHRVFPPSSLKYAMWEMQVERMQGEMVRRGIPPLTAEERELILDYLRRHAADGTQRREQEKSA